MVTQGIYEVPLPNSVVSIIDSADKPIIDNWGAKWRTDTKGYAVSAKRVAGEVVNTSLHRLIMGVAGAVQIDHINGIKLDNRRSNLRICTGLQNMRNRPVYRTSRSGLKGVLQRPSGFIAKITVNSRRLYLGTYPSAKEAALVYDAAARKFYGEFAWLNFPGEAKSLADNAVWQRLQELTTA
jgi:hypothetical protein